MGQVDIVNQAAEVVCQVEQMVRYAHQLLRSDEINRNQFLEVKELEMKAQKLHRNLKYEDG